MQGLSEKMRGPGQLIFPRAFKIQNKTGQKIKNNSIFYLLNMMSIFYLSGSFTFKNLIYIICKVKKF